MMIKNVLATVGVLAVVGGIVVWQFGFLSKQAKDASIKIDRATAAARAEKMIETTQANVDKLDEKARQYRIEARTLEIKLERQEADVEKTESSIRKLIQAAANAGLPKPSEKDSLTDEQRAITLTFGNKTVGAEPIYAALEKWNEKVKAERVPITARRKIVERKNAAADKLVENQKKMNEAVVELKSKLEDLRVTKDIAAVDVQLAQIESDVRGVSTDEIGKVLNVIQGEIDELEATYDVITTEPDAQEATLEVNDVVETANGDDELDQLWNETTGTDAKLEKTESKTEDVSEIEPKDLVDKPTSVDEAE